jgi:hypothetical protein
MESADRKYNRSVFRECRPILGLRPGHNDQIRRAGFVAQLDCLGRSAAEGVPNLPGGVLVGHTEAYDDIVLRLLGSPPEVWH